MPGGRLTQQDRRQIAAGLAEGLSYAEIGRRLERPTSTVTREVTRNGGPHGYRADQAHQATERRARRRRTAPVPASPAVPADDYGRDPEAVRELSDRLTDMLFHSGMTRMASGVLACLYLSDSGSLTAADLVRRLNVSPASVSKAIGYLEEQRLVRRERDARGRRERYVIDDDVWFQAMVASARGTITLSDVVGDGAEVLGPGTPAGARLLNMSRFLDHVGRDLMRAAEHWRVILREDGRD